MKQITVNIKKEANQSYSITIGENVPIHEMLLEENKYSKVLYLIDENLNDQQIMSMVKNIAIPFCLMKIKAKDKNKTVEQTTQIWKELYKNNFDRKSLVVNIGGGMICDIGGFAASTYMRGIPFIHIPTTLLSQVDASIGGKTGVNIMGGKNIVGTFQQPIMVIIDVAYLDTLPKREFYSGFAEIIKHGIISGKEHFSLFTHKKPEQYSKNELINIIEQSCLIKKAIVEEDVNENSKRKILNLGHTIGHAIESLSLETNNPLLHGEAISIGIVTECKLAELAGILPREKTTQIENSLEIVGLPIQIKNLSQKKIFEVIVKDKKNEKGVIKWTLPEDIGKIRYNLVIKDKLIKQAITKTIYE